MLSRCRLRPGRPTQWVVAKTGRRVCPESVSSSMRSGKSVITNFFRITMERTMIDECQVNSDRCSGVPFARQLHRTVRLHGGPCESPPAIYVRQRPCILAAGQLSDFQFLKFVWANFAWIV